MPNDPGSGAGRLHNAIIIAAQNRSEIKCFVEKDLENIYESREGTKSGALEPLRTDHPQKLITMATLVNVYHDLGNFKAPVSTTPSKFKYSKLIFMNEGARSTCPI